MVVNLWRVVSRFWFMISRLWLVVGRLWFNIMVDRMSKVMPMVHHVSHVGILLHVVAGHPDPKHLLKTEGMPGMGGVDGHNIPGWVLVVGLVHGNWLVGWFRSTVGWFRSMICRLWGMVCWFRGMVCRLWGMVCWFRSVVCWFRVMVVLPMVEHENILKGASMFWRSVAGVFWVVNVMGDCHRGRDHVSHVDRMVGLMVW